MICILLCGIFALFYVHQEVEIVKTSFLINKHHRQVTLLLDQYRSLVYNLSRLESPKRIEDTLCINEITLCMPPTENIRRFGEKIETKQSFLASIFDRFSTEAEAEVVR